MADGLTLLLALGGAIAAVLLSGFFVALLLFMWGPENRFGPKDHPPYRAGTFSWCWEMAIKGVLTPILVFFMGMAVWSLCALSFTPFIEVVTN